MGSEESARNEIIDRRPPDGCFESEDGFFAEGCDRGVNESGSAEGVVEMSKNDLLLQNVCVVSNRESRREAVVGVCESERGEARLADSLVEKECVEVEGLFSGSHGVLESELEENRVPKKREKTVCSALAESGSDTRDEKKKVLEKWEKSGAWRRERGEVWNEARVVDDVIGVLRAVKENALGVLRGVLVLKNGVMGACAGRGWKKKSKKGPLVPLSTGREMGEA